MALGKTNKSLDAYTDIQGDTDEHVGTVIDMTLEGEAEKILCAFQNLTDQTVSFQVYGKLDYDGTPKWPIGDATSVLAATDYDYAILTEPWPYLVVSATAGSNPSSGSVSAYIVKIK